ncbi:FkbM family methyltransferase [Mucilaginibacter glaciei]|uniref:FkbM family methyltransferase n=1 Tax=Mucilaginibacter glaciei TaxID=2772109 RepID=A0A926NQ91_9SPHI|nr:FkbM family methyltransferase [Mucilaginibacter glaciei]MBD1395331.1 FkbM family methyltransferase [Mucilaginibacter glaciei]
MFFFTRCIYPLSLRARVTCKLYDLFQNVHDKNISLEFNKQVKLDVSKTDYGHKSIIFNGFYELDLTRDIIKLAEKGGLLIDVGANYGYYTCLWAAQKPGNKAIAFEASPGVLAPLKNNVTKNNLQNNVTIVATAAGKENGILKFSLGGDAEQTSWAGFTIMEDAGAVEVPVITLDGYALENGIETIDVLKIDTEGADTWVLFGAKKLLQQKRIHHIFYEHNTHRMGLLNIGPNEAADFLKSVGYTVEKYFGNDFYAYPNPSV